MDLRPLSPLERRAGTQPIRLVDDRSDCAGHTGPDEGDHGGDLPDRPHPSRDHRPGRCHLGGAARRQLLPRRRQRRGAQRAHPRRPLARGRRAAGDARGGRRGDPQAVEGRRPRPSRAPLPGRARPRLRPAGRACRRSSSRASDPRRSSSRHASATATAPSAPTPRQCARSASGPAGRPRPGRHEGLLGRGRGAELARRSIACGRTRRCQGSWPKCCRRPSTSSRRASS